MVGVHVDLKAFFSVLSINVLLRDVCPAALVAFTLDKLKIDVATGQAAHAR